RTGPGSSRLAPHRPNRTALQVPGPGAEDRQQRLGRPELIEVGGVLRAERRRETRQRSGAGRTGPLQGSGEASERKGKRARAAKRQERDRGRHSTAATPATL